MKLKLIVMFLPMILVAQAPLEDIADLPNDVRWVVNSQEYISICQQTYFNAMRSLNPKLKHTENPVIIMDIDETVLDNSKYQIELFLNQTSYNPTTWNKWVNNEESTLVPGAKDFILWYKNIPKSRIIYISNRDHSTLQATINNMKNLGIFFEDDIFILRKNQADTKVIRRQEVFDGSGRMKKHGPQKIIAYFGDAMGDFPLDESYQLSKNKFLFPNPMYGKW